MNTSTFDHNAAGIPPVQRLLDHAVNELALLIGIGRNTREATDKCFAEFSKSYLDMMNGPHVNAAKMILDAVPSKNIDDETEMVKYFRRFIRYTMAKQSYSVFNAGMKRDARKYQNQFLVAMQRLEDVWPDIKRTDMVPSFTAIFKKIREADVGFGGVDGLVKAYDAKVREALQTERAEADKTAKAEEAREKAARMAELNITDEKVYDDYIKNEQAIDERNRASGRITEWLSQRASLTLPFNMKDDGIYIMFEGTAVKVPFPDVPAMWNAMVAMETYSVKPSKI